MRRILLLVLLTTFSFPIGCGGPPPLSEEVAADSSAAWANAIEAFDAKDFAACSDHLDAALAGGGLPPDVCAEAQLKRAVCRARLDRFDEALADLAEVEQGPVNLAVVHMTRSYVYKKQGKAAESKAEAATAKKIDRRVKALKD